MQMPVKKPLVFVSYCHKDEQYKDKLITHLGTLQKADLFEVWSDEQIPGGAEWEKKIFEAMENANLAILLITAQFLTSDFILTKEIPKLLEMHKSKGLIVFPIIAEDSPRPAWLATFNFRPKNGRAIWSGNNPDVNKDLKEITEEINNLLADYQKKIGGSKPMSQSSPKVLFGTLSVEENGIEKILTYQDPRDEKKTHLFPIVELQDPAVNSIEDAITHSINKLNKELAITEREFLEAGIYEPVYYQLHKIASYGGKRKAIPIPYIFFRIQLQNKIKMSPHAKRKFYYWTEKTEVKKQWLLYDHFDQHLNEDEIPIAEQPELSENLFKVINSAFVRNEFGFKMLECVDTLMFTMSPDKSEPEFFMMFRSSPEGWEYPRGRLLYYETKIEGALRTIEEEAGIQREQLKYCGDLGWQTVDVRIRDTYYEMLKVYGFVFYIEKQPDKNLIKLKPLNSNHKWMTLEEVRKEMWHAEQDYNQIFLNRLEEKETEIFQQADISI
jgi:hypothetical protein